LNNLFRHILRTRPGSGPWLPIRIRVFFSERFVDRIGQERKALRKDPMQLYKTIRNAKRGFLLHERAAFGGRDGVFELSQKWDNPMTREINTVYSDKELMQRMKASYPFLNEPCAKVRLVAHPNHLRIRPVGFITCYESDTYIEQFLLLVGLAVEAKGEK